MEKPIASCEKQVSASGKETKDRWQGKTLTRTVHEIVLQTTKATAEAANGEPRQADPGTYSSLTMTLHPATTNTGKFAEFAKSAGSVGVQVLKLPGIDLMPEPVEDAATFMGNAEIKAIAYSKLAPGALVFADDSGLECDDLGGQPGVRSARFADDLSWKPQSGCKDTRNNLCLLSLLAELPNPSRSARFVCTLALARDGKVLLRAEAEVEGRILDSPRGLNGFGYDPLFMLPALGQTMAELPREQKWSLGHRGKAFRALLAQIAESRVDGN